MKNESLTIRFNEDTDVIIECNYYSDKQKLNIELPKDFNQGVKPLKIIADQIQSFCSKHSIKEYEIYLVQYFFTCKNYIHEALRKNYPEYFI